MKNVKIYLFLLAIAASFGNCNLLDQSSPNDIDATVAIQTAADAEAALLGVYSSMQQRAYYGGQFLLMNDALADNATTGGYNVLSLDQITNRNITSANILVEETWIAIYRVVANANYLLAALPNVKDLTTLRKGEIEGTARAIRALAHFDLLRYFGEHWNATSAFGVPIVTTPQKIDDVPSRATVAATYKFITDELTAASSLIKSTNVTPQYINRNTVAALSARVFLYQNNKPQAAAFAKQIIDNQKFTLIDAADYGKIFTTRRTSESIFELAFDNQNRSAYNNLTYSRDSAIRPEIFFLASESLGNFFGKRPTDVRGALVDFDGKNNNSTILPDGRSQKYRGEDAQDNPAYIIRLAEMHLIYAEASGKTAGLPSLNLLRTARGLSALKATDVPTDAAFLTAVLDERRAELNFEGHRYFDLARTQRIKSVLGTDNFRAILPIPNREIAASGGKLAQNLGY